MLNKEEVRLAIGDGVAKQLYDDNPVLARALTEPTKSLTASLLASDQFQQIFRSLSERLNQYLIQGNRESVAIDLTGILDIVRSVANNINPERDQKIQADELKIVLLEPNDLPDLRGVGITTLLLGPYAFVILLIIFGVSWVKVKSKRELFKLTGYVFVITSALILLVTWTQATILNAAITTVNGDIVVRAIFDVFTRNLYIMAVLLGVVGLLFIFSPIVYDFVRSKTKRP